MSDVLKAAERLAKLGRFDLLLDNDVALKVVLDYARSTIRPDDAEPITAEWLVSVGGIKSGPGNRIEFIIFENEWMDQWINFESDLSASIFLEV